MRDKSTDTELKGRLDLRVDTTLKDKFKAYCGENNLTLSDAGRDALDVYMISMTFIGALVDKIQDPEFYKTFKKFHSTLPKELKTPFDLLLSPEEKKLIDETPYRLLKNVKVITRESHKKLNGLL